MGRSTQSLKTTDMADAAEDAKRKEELNASLKEYIAEWRKTREAEEDELAKLKEKQAKRKEIRAEQEKKLNAAITRRRRSVWRRLRPRDRRCSMPRRHRRLTPTRRRSPLLVDLAMTPARSSPRPRSSSRRRRRLLCPSESSPSSLRLWTLMR